MSAVAAIELKTNVTLGAWQWTDDPDDKPLQYLFAYLNNSADADATRSLCGPKALSQTVTRQFAAGNYTAIAEIHDTRHARVARAGQTSPHTACHDCIAARKTPPHVMCGCGPRRGPWLPSPTDWPAGHLCAGDVRLRARARARPIYGSAIAPHECGG